MEAVGLGALGWSSGDEQTNSNETRNSRGSRFMSCINPLFLLTPSGVLKILQIVAAAICIWMMVNLEANKLSTKYMFFVGFSFRVFLVCLFSCMTLTSVLLLTYVLSKESYTLVRSTTFELLFNGCAACLYFGLFVYLCYTLSLVYHIFEKLKPGSPAYPALVIAEEFSFVLGVLYIADAVMAFTSYFRHMKSMKQK